MGGKRVFRVLRRRRQLVPLAKSRRTRPRDFIEWRTLRAWGQLPSWEIEPPGYLLRLAREGTGLTQRALAERMGITQQAIAQAEKWTANPTVAFLRRWATACEMELEIVFRRERTGE